ncbi:hypothetical protein [Affinibrenneria salicis]|uniref:hypothetical protein n=1 Tax=Affinibrenneria salicis TaxID=2590031 RepID=UPI001CC42D6C|nr:hypothetical protein [Affinibrenneria salicis]
MKRWLSYAISRKTTGLSTDAVWPNGVQRSFRVEVTIVAETCSKQQKAQYQREVFNAMSALIGNVPPHANVHVIDRKAASCGHGVITQEYRFQHQDEFYR